MADVWASMVDNIGYFTSVKILHVSVMQLFAVKIVKVEIEKISFI